MIQKDPVHPDGELTGSFRGYVMGQIHTEFYADSKIKFSLDLYRIISTIGPVDLVDMDRSPHLANVQMMVSLILLQ